MAELKEGCFELDGFVFGGSAADGLWVSNYIIDEVPWTEDEYDSQHGGRTLFGAAFPSGPKWTFTVSTMTGDPASALDRMESALGVWRNTDKLSNPNTEMVLRYTRAGRTRRVYGRPRAFLYDTNGFLRVGSWDAEASFRASDPWFYDDVLRSVTVKIVRTSSGGVAFPTVFPWVSEPGEERVGIIQDTGGKRKAPMIIKISGPVQNPVVRGDGWKIALDTNLLYDQSVTIDTRKNTVLRNDGVSLGGALTNDSRLTNAMLRPGPDEVRFSGVDVTGTAQCQVSWRPTYYGM